jgi:asparagine synthase (glutamine-hydrolysing)
MCGIAGIMTAGGAPAPESLDALERALAHRGPDGSGRYVSGNLGMVHTRLAIIDLATGDQPIRDNHHTALIANAEIYNYIELRQDMSGVAFATASDCEPPLHLYREFGSGFAEKLRGMYAIAIHDSAANRLLLSRDPFGIKPLYYAETSNAFAFASEPQALIASGVVPARVNSHRRSELLQLQFTTGDETIFDGIRRVAPGETLVISGGRIIERRRRLALPRSGPRVESEEEAIKRLDAALEDSVRLHQRSDVPYGMFLSGGIDSTALLVMMARLNDRPVRAFTAGFSGAQVADERAHAKLVATRLGADHIEVEVSEQDFWRSLPAIAGAMDDPAADYAVVPTYKLAAVARQELKVVLSGEGGDEMFAGYGRYRSVLRPWWLGGRALRPRGILEGTGVLRAEQPSWRDGIVAAEINATLPNRTKLQIAQATDCADWLPNDLLIKLDRCLMAHGVEGRTPFLDPAVADAAFRLPDSLKIRKGLGKFLLREWLARHLPEAQPFSRKRGFTVPVGEWIARKGKVLGPLVAAEAGVEQICHPKAVQQLFASTGKHAHLAAWVLLFYALWHRRHILGLDPAGDVLETLAQSN